MTKLQAVDSYIVEKTSCSLSSCPRNDHNIEAVAAIVNCIGHVPHLLGDGMKYAAIDAGVRVVIFIPSTAYDLGIDLTF